MKRYMKSADIKMIQRANVSAPKSNITKNNHKKLKQRKQLSKKQLYTPKLGGKKKTPLAFIFELILAFYCC